MPSRGRWQDWDAGDRRHGGDRPALYAGRTARLSRVEFRLARGELVRRIAGKPIDEVAAERIFDPLELAHTGIGLDDDEPDEVATLTAFEAFDRCRNPNAGLVGDHTQMVPPFNEEGIHRAVIPAANGIGTAADLARFYACLVNDGALDGTRILHRTPLMPSRHWRQKPTRTATMSIPSRYGLGVWLTGPKVDRFGSLAPIGTFGHSGLGSSVGWADPRDDIAFAYVTNGVRELSYEHIARINTLSDAVRLACQY
ncbi:MAG: serine hydrolase domain-containing protein [Natrialbaceae archaeon]|nr:serine hydrolase domain-containing protein [Natrialbaceae archaeon]